MSFFDAKQLYFVCLYVFEPVFVASSDEKTLYLLLKSIYSVFNFFFNVNCLLMVYSVYHCSCFFEICYWGQILLLLYDGRSSNGFVSLVCGIRRAPEFVEMHTNLAPGSQTLFRHKWRTLCTLLFLFIVLVSIVASLNAKTLFHPWVRFEIEVLSYCIFTEKFAIGFQNWFGHESIELESSCCSRPRLDVIISVSTKIYMNSSFVFLFDDMTPFW